MARGNGRGSGRKPGSPSDSMIIRGKTTLQGCGKRPALTAGNLEAASQAAAADHEPKRLRSDDAAGSSGVMQCLSCLCLASEPGVGNLTQGSVFVQACHKLLSWLVV